MRSASGGRFLFIWAAVFLVLATAVSVQSPANAAEKVRIAGLTWPGYGFWFIAKKEGFTKGLDVSYQPIEDPTQSFNMMSSGQLDIVSSTIEFAPIAASQGMPVKLVAYGNLSYGTDKIIVAPDIKEAKDLRGKKIAVLEGGLSQLFAGIWLDQHGVSIKDVKFVNLIMDRAAAALASGDVSAAEFWEPFGSQALQALPGSHVVASSRDPAWTRLALIADALFMSDKFIHERRKTALTMMRALYESIAWWRKHPAEGNKIIADGMKMSVKDVELVLGKDGSGKDGGLYPYSFMETARFCGAAPGDPPFGQHNGQIYDHWKLLNTWWVKFGQMKTTVDPSKGIDCSLLADLYKAGFK